MLLSNLMFEKGTLKFGQIFNKATGQIELLSFAGMLWEVFKGLLFQTFDALRIPSLKEVLKAMQGQFEELLDQALQMDACAQQALHKAEIKGVL